MNSFELISSQSSKVISLFQVREGSETVVRLPSQSIR